MWRRLALCAALGLAIEGCGQHPTAAVITPTAGVSSASPVAVPSPAPATPVSSPTLPIETAASFARSQPAAPALAGQAGAIRGHLGCPCDLTAIEQAVYAITVDGRFYYRTETVRDQVAYTIDGVAPGDYLVFSLSRNTRDPYPGMPPRQFDAGYTRAIACGLSVACNDHTPIPIHVTAGATTSNVDPVDWYGSFGLVPGDPQYGSIPAPAGFASPVDAVLYIGESMLRAKQVNSFSECGANSACYVLDSGVHAGQNAAYMTGIAGSNQDLLTCALYVVKDASGWHAMDLRCGVNGLQMPSLGGSAHVSRSKVDSDKPCVVARTSPSVNASVAACLADGTAVTVDGGPAFAPPSPSNGFWAGDVWWHAAGIGWVGHLDIYN